MNPHVRLLVGLLACHNFLKAREFTSHVPIGALVNICKQLFKGKELENLYTPLAIKIEDF